MKIYISRLVCYGDHLGWPALTGGALRKYLRYEGMTMPDSPQEAIPLRKLFAKAYSALSSMSPDERLVFAKIDDPYIAMFKLKSSAWWKISS